MKKIVLIEPSFLNRVKDDKIILEKELPPENCIYLFDDTLADEIEPNRRYRKGEKYKIILEIMRNNHFQFLGGCILSEEMRLSPADIKKNLYSPDNTTLYSPHKTADLLNFLENPEKFPEIKEYFEKKISRRQERARDTFKKINVSKEQKPIFKHEDLHARLNDEFKNKESIVDFVWETYCDALLLCGRDEPPSHLKEKIYNEFNDLKSFRQRFPTFYIILVCTFFIDLLKKPSTYAEYNNKDKIKPFKMFLSEPIYIKNFINNKQEKIENIEININFIADFRISLLPLHYYDCLATCDKGQTALVSYLFPEYAAKIRWYNVNS